MPDASLDGVVETDDLFYPGGMGVSLNIKNEKTCRLAGELAELTGETKTGAITVALEERLERERHRRSADTRLRKMRAISSRCARLLREGGPPIDHGDLFYDELGLPR